MGNALERFFGGPPVRTIVWLAFLSVVIGFVLATMGMDPFTLVRRVLRGFDSLVDAVLSLGSGIFLHAGRWLVYGAVIVVPVWIVLRVMALGRGRS
ncbi:DUF6460 domain-containing protein [Prosthecomicrobium sp. N25]|uniref:DUF6460 domain-containing protein n=1 Tax=Prosthecomicrobium sp. N25 TaxID=3129254 RepID=UPI003078652D